MLYNCQKVSKCKSDTLDQNDLRGHPYLSTFSLMNKTVIMGGGGVHRPGKMSDFIRKNGGRGGQKVMTVLFIQENFDNYGRPLTKDSPSIGHQTF